MRASWFWAAWATGLSLLSGCATWKAGEYSPIPDTGVECLHAPAPQHPAGETRIQCRAKGDPTTAKAMVVGEHGASLVGEVNGALFPASK